MEYKQNVQLLSALYATCPYYIVLYMQSVLIPWCCICNVSLLLSAFICKVSLFFSAFICKVSLFFSALYAKCPYSLVLYMQSVLII